jgi:hypothetical protein
MNAHRWDWIDWVKAFGYGAFIGGIALSFLGDKRIAATLRGVSTACGLVSGTADLAEPPKHCGCRAIYNASAQSWICAVCLRPIPNQPKLFDWQ